MGSSRVDTLFDERGAGGVPRLKFQNQFDPADKLRLHPFGDVTWTKH
jgi:hypothetical protein